MTTVAFIGAAHIHTPGFIRMIQSRPDVKVKYVQDHLAARGQTRAKELGATYTADAQQVLDDGSVDGVIVCSTTAEHLRDVGLVAAAKKHVFVEKPLGMNYPDAQRMADEIDRAGVIFQTGYFMRSDAKHRFLKQQIEAGNLGKITRIRGSNCHQGALGGWFDSKPDKPHEDWRWMADVKQSGCGAFGDLGTHIMDIMVWMLGPVQQATAMIDTGTQRHNDTDETGEGLTRIKNGATGTLAPAWLDWSNPATLLVSGTEGHAAIINGQLHFTSKKDAKFDGTAPVRASELPANLPHAFELFLDKLAGKDVPLVAAKEAAYRNAVFDAMYEGARQGKWVTVAG
ncbi:MAG TPA: Gfo/Idh/MocA family oxidoreductase [Tepidisphaeraceae bacterium]|nr:Gfo/Idh/MocA family oxidoreductase [Tepidisphaeraceae bacterium]